MTLPPNIQPPDLRRSWVALLAAGSLVAGAVGFFVLDGLAFVMDGQDTVSELLWAFLSWGPASYVAVGGTLATILGWAALHILGRGRLG